MSKFKEFGNNWNVISFVKLERLADFLEHFFYFFGNWYLSLLDGLSFLVLLTLAHACMHLDSLGFANLLIFANIQEVLFSFELSLF